MKTLVEIWEKDKPKLPFIINVDDGTNHYKNIIINNVIKHQRSDYSFYVSKDQMGLYNSTGLKLENFLGTDNFNGYAELPWFTLVSKKKSRLPIWF